MFNKLNLLLSTSSKDKIPPSPYEGYSTYYLTIAVYLDTVQAGWTSEGNLGSIYPEFNGSCYFNDLFGLVYVNCSKGSFYYNNHLYEDGRTEKSDSSIRSTFREWLNLEGQTVIVYIKD